MSTRALLRRPGPRLAEGLLTHLERTPVDLDLAARQWDAYAAALEREGWELYEVEPADDCPDAVFVEDTVVVYGGLAVITRPGAEQRRPETAGTEEALRGLGLGVVHITEPATLEGGDVLKHGGTVWVGVGGRSDVPGAAQLAGHLDPLGARTVPVPIGPDGPVLHLKSAVTVLPDGAALGFEPHVVDASPWESFLAVPEESGAHVVLLGGQRVLMAESAPQTRALLEERGLEVVAVDISEFEKLEGCVTCLSVRLRG